MFVRSARIQYFYTHIIPALVVFAFVLAFSGCARAVAKPDHPAREFPEATSAKTKPVLPLTWTLNSGLGENNSAIEALLIESRADARAAHGDDHGDSRSTATRVTAGASVSGTLAPGDIDVFVVTVRESGTLTATTTGTTDTVGGIMDSSDVLAVDDDSGSGSNFQVAAAVGAGTFYVGVLGYYESTVGDYELLVSFSPDNSVDDDDDHGDSRSTATWATAGTQVAGSLTPGDVDVFALTVEESGTLSATTTGTTDTFGVLQV